MNQQTLLASIQRHLRDPRGEQGTLRPLSEIVSLVAAEVRQPQSSAVTQVEVVPVGVVAAFVDGQVSDEEERCVLSAVQVDNSVLAELVAAVIASEESPTNAATMTDTFAARLMTMASGSEHASLSEHVPLPISLATTAVKSTSRFKRHRWALPVSGAAVIAATAAAWIVAVRWAPSNDSSPTERDVVVSSPAADGGDSTLDRVAPSSTSIPPSHETPIPNETRVELVESPTTRPTEPTRPGVNDPAPMPKVNQGNVDQGNSLSPESVVDVDAGSPSMQMPRDGDSVRPLDEWTWTRLTGLVAFETTPPANPDYAPREVWSALPQATKSFSDPSERQAMRLATLPLSRAEASNSLGGSLVLGSDSMIRLRDDYLTAERTITCVLDVEYGSVALVNIARGTVINLQARGTPIAKLQWDSDASVVIGYLPQGFTVQIHSGSLSVDNEPHDECVLVLAPGAKTQVNDAGKRLPTWVDRPIESLPISKVVLAQLAESRDVLGDISKQASVLAASPNKNQNDVRTLATLALWQASLTGPNVARLLNRTEPEIRNAALQRLVETPDWEPRYETMWAGAERILQTPLITPQVQQICEQLQHGVGLMPAQTELLLTGLASTTVARRALCDYLLRSHFRGGPPYDPTWTGQTQLRAIAQWRRMALR